VSVRSVPLFNASVPCVNAGAAAQSSDILGSLPPPGSLTTALYFPEHAQKQFPAGDVVRNRIV
jgi:hypothetical protein